MDVDSETVKWWKNQSSEAIKEVFDPKFRVDIKDCLIKLKEFIKDCEYIWANSPNFDCVILENAFNLCGIEIPWKYWNLRDCRTVYDIGNVNLKNFTTKNTAHNSLLDAYAQILCLQQAFKNLKKF